MDDKKLTEQIQALKKEKEEALTKISDLQKQVCCKYNGSWYERATFVEACMVMSRIFIFFFLKDWTTKRKWETVEAEGQLYGENNARPAGKY